MNPTTPPNHSSTTQTQLVAHPPPIETILLPSGKFFEEAITLFATLTSSFPGPQFPCSPHPQARTSPSRVSARVCSLPTAIFSIDGRSGGAHWPWSLRPHDRSVPSSLRRTMLPHPALTSLQFLILASAGGLTSHLSFPRNKLSPSPGEPRRYVNSLPQTALTTLNPTPSTFRGSCTTSAGSPSWPFRPLPQPYTSPLSRTTITWPMHAARSTTSLSGEGKSGRSSGRGERMIRVPCPSSPFWPMPKVYTSLARPVPSAATTTEASHIAAQCVTLGLALISASADLKALGPHSSVESGDTCDSASAEAENVNNTGLKLPDVEGGRK
ncbi:cell cycle checkpoint control protein [Pseudogymnoascus destructans]|uniref:Cell cycle checkpoint control protein n=1 Tax=Pseudogymnoascus destructans TaxID=655981 RepID=A0A177AAC3_9PEZI|nr:cell cycle checkpoint control protein [Pseudogymnoascus destructans]OAF58143.1 cell cycle checkpoint control protein [Pseudogymnoascus destructans]